MPWDFVGGGLPSPPPRTLITFISTRGLGQMTWTVNIEQDEDGSLIVPLPDELLAQLSVGIGDSL